MMLGIGISASAYTGTAYGDLYYKVNDDNTAVTITDCHGLATEVIIPSKIEGLPVTSIGSSAFRYCSSLETISIGKNVTSIGESAFEYSGLKKVSIRTGLMLINSSWFSGCSKLETVEIPNTVIGILQNAFSGCSNLKEVRYTETEAEWNEIAIATSNDYITNATKVYNYTAYKMTWDKTINTVNIKGDIGTYDVIFSDVNGKIIPVEVTFTEEGVKDVAMPDGMSTSGLKVFLWDSLESMKPLADAIAVN